MPDDQQQANAKRQRDEHEESGVELRFHALYDTQSACVLVVRQFQGFSKVSSSA